MVFVDGLGKDMESRTNWCPLSAPTLTSYFQNGSSLASPDHAFCFSLHIDDGIVDDKTKRYAAFSPFRPILEPKKHLDLRF